MQPRAVFPISLLLEGRPCLVIGGRATAQMRAEGLLDVGAKVTVIAPDITAELAALPVTPHRRRFQAGDTAGFVLVISATGDPEVDAQVHADGRAHGVLVNAVDNPASCDLYVPAVLRRGALSVAISSGGGSPAIASWARDRIGDALGEEVAVLTEIVAQVRTEVRANGRSSEGLPWGALIDELAAALRSGATREETERRAEAWRTALDGPEAQVAEPGRAENRSTDG